MCAKFSFQPDYLVPPGVTLKETLETKGISQTALSSRTGLSEKTVSQIINGVAPISYDTAEKLELATGVPAGFWNRRELSYREAVIRSEEHERFECESEWLKKIPVKELIARGYLPAIDDTGAMVREALKFFGVSSVRAWDDTWLKPRVQYRSNKAEDKYPGYVAAWLRIGELDAENIVCQPYDERCFRDVLNEVRKFSVEPAKVWRKRLPELCSSAGVAFVLTKEIPKAAISGATRWLSKNKALIQVSLKYKTDDQFWFAIFHEAGHILKHSKKREFLELRERANTREEHEANAFARDALIPPQFVHTLPHLKSKMSVTQFAASIGIAPGIVVGRLQHDFGLDKAFMNGLKVTYKWA